MEDLTDIKQDEQVEEQVEASLEDVDVVDADPPAKEESPPPPPPPSPKVDEVMTSTVADHFRELLIENVIDLHHNRVKYSVRKSHIVQRILTILKDPRDIEAAKREIVNLLGGVNKVVIYGQKDISDRKFFTAKSKNKSGEKVKAWLEDNGEVIDQLKVRNELFNRFVVAVYCTKGATKRSANKLEYIIAYFRR